MRGEDFGSMQKQPIELGSPPHARGRLGNFLGLKNKRGITPACAGKTALVKIVNAFLKDHPRMRGEDAAICTFQLQAIGSPPHARGRRACARPDAPDCRITPACAGKTTAPPSRRRGLRDHPRMRGEDTEPFHSTRSFEGSPPHARGRHIGFVYNTDYARITPACAGKTPTQGGLLARTQDHPRMRGEDGVQA